MQRLFLALSVLAASACAAPAQEVEVDTRIVRGEALARNMCAECHAIGKAGESPHSSAPPFRTLERRLDLNSFLDRLRQGLMSSHPDMPTFRFTRDDARDLVAYLRSIQAP